MEWKPEVKNLYEKSVLGIPETVRPIVRPALLEATERKCSERQGKIVAEVDLISALFEVTPAVFQPTMIADLQKNGVDTTKYIVRFKTDFQLHNDLNKMVDDIMKLCEITGVKGNKDAIWNVIKSYEPFFTGASISMRTTTKPVEKRDVSTRYVETMIPHKPDPHTTAINNGLIKNDNHPIHKMYQETLDTLEVIGYGVDLDARFGLSKIWTFLVPDSIDRLASMKYAPKSLKNFMNNLKKHALTLLAIIGFDFSNNTMNIYFMLKQPPTATREKCEALVKECGFKVESQEIMEKCAQAVHLSYTFSWASDKVERICFGMATDNMGQVPVHFHPLMKEFVEKTPLQSEKGKFIYSVTFTPKGLYYKIENDYNASMIKHLLLSCEAGIEVYN